MDRGVRKFVVGLIALAALLGVFLLYTRFNEALPVATEIRRTAPELESDANAAGSEAQGGTILGTAVRRVEQTQFFHTNEHGDVDREFGFEELLHKQGDQWEITKPYMRVILPAFRCDVTAEWGQVRLETIFGRAVPSDATFSGNVIIHIVPAEPNDPWESFICLDNVGFVAEKSLFSTLGPVRFLSRNARLTGTGMEMLYDSLRSRLELFRVFDLDSLRLRSSAFGAMAGLTAKPGSTGATASPRSAGPDRSSGATPEQPEAVPHQTANIYQCFFRRNVTIETPERTVTAADGLSIHNILWAQATDPGATAPRGEPNVPKRSAAAPAEAPRASISSYQTLDSLPQESFDVVVACDGGFVITPADSGPVRPGDAPDAQPGRPDAQRPFDRAALRAEAAPKPPSRPEAGQTRGPDGRATVRARSKTPDRQHTAAKRIDFDAATKDAILAGPVEMMFYLDPNALHDQQAGRGPMPMTISARQSIRFLATVNQVLLEGDCTATVHRTEPNVTYEYALTAPRFTLDVGADPNAAERDKAAGRTTAPGTGAGDGGVTVRRFVASGGFPGREDPCAVGLQIFRRGLDQRLLGWTRLDATELQYDATPREFTATGPGVLWVHNAETLDAKADPNQFSLGRSCYACVNNFDTLRYAVSTGRISAAARSRQLLLDYFPLTGTGYKRHIQAVAGHIEALVRPAGPPGIGEAPAGRMDLAELTASEGIDFEDEKYHFVGSILHYDHSKDLITVRGDPVQPCMLNGARVDQIEMNLKTGYVSAPVTAPSIVQVR